MKKDRKGILAIGIAAVVAAGIWLASRAKPSPPPPGLANLYGKVTDAVTRTPVSNVLVTLDGMQVYTDAKGDYAFTNLEPGAYTITFEKEGYETATF